MNRNMKNLLGCIIVLMLTSVIGNASPLMVTQGRASQKAGTRLVDVNYDVSGGVPPYTVTLQGSSDGGGTWTLPVTTVSGHVGAGVAAGSNRLVTWNAGADWAGQVSANVKFRVNVMDAAPPPVPDGFALIPAGSFTMGDQSNPLVGGSNELPVHSVQMSAFYMAKYETTKELWDEVRAWGLTHSYTDLAVGNGGYPSKGVNHPVHYINWDDAVKWCNARSEKENLTPCYYTNVAQTLIYKTGAASVASTMAKWNANGYRLPTEAEWEKAARGGLVGNNFPWGNTISHSYANYMVNSVNGSTNTYSYDVTPRPPATGTNYYHPSYVEGGIPYTAPVDSFTPNGYGLFNMSGNVWEWCWDWYGGYTTGSQTDSRGPASGSYRVYRVGGWGYNASTCRVSHRGWGPRTRAYYDLGFRTARSSAP